MASSWLGLLLVGITVLGYVEGFCRDTWERPSGSQYCYKFMRDRRTWDSAQSACIAEGAQLATIRDSNTDSYLRTSLYAKESWFGLRRTSSAWTWVDGTAYSYSNFETGFPQEASRPACGGYCPSPDLNPKWCDGPCNLQGYYICEYKALCSAGEYKDSDGSCKKCPKGRYHETGGSSGVNSCFVCPAGRYGDTEGETRANCAGACDKGHYCPQESTSAKQVECPAGRYGASTGLTSVLCSGLCPAGKLSRVSLTRGEYSWTVSPVQWGLEGPR